MVAGTSRQKDVNPPDEAILAIARALARDAALTEYRRQQQQAASHDHLRSDLRAV